MPHRDCSGSRQGLYPCPPSLHIASWVPGTIHSAALSLEPQVPTTSGGSRRSTVWHDLHGEQGTVADAKRNHWKSVELGCARTSAHWWCDAPRWVSVECYSVEWCSRTALKALLPEIVPDSGKRTCTAPSNGTQLARSCDGRLHGGSQGQVFLHTST